MPSEVTDPALLAQLNGTSQPQEVTDPQLLSQLNGSPKRYGSGAAGMKDVLADGTLAPSNSPQAQAAISPVAGNSFLQNARIGAGKLYTDVGLGARQLYAQAADAISPQDQTLSGLITGQQPSRLAPLQQEAADKRALDAPVMGTAGGQIGRIAGALPLAVLPGANTYAGAALTGAGMGALQPTAPGESRALNAGLGAATGLAGNYAGNKVTSWISQRAAQPFMGWNQNTVNQAAAQAVGSNAPRLNQPALAETSQRLGSIFDAARSPAVTVPVGTPTARAIVNAQQGLNRSTLREFQGNAQIQNLTDYLRVANRSATAQQLGNVSTRLGQQANSQMTSQTGNRELGRALFSIKEHVDDLIGNSITDPGLQAAYATARPQYRQFLSLTSRPSILNSSTGNVNPTNLGKYLQKADKSGYTLGGNQSPLYQAARWGQGNGVSTQPPPVLRHFGLDWMGYQAAHNPVTQATGGLLSRGLLPVNRAVPGGIRGLMYGLEPSATDLE